jgi:hypothetical protein
MQPAVVSHAAPWVQQLASPQVAQAPAGKTPTQLPAPPVPELVALDVEPVLVDVASLVLVLVLVEAEVDPPVPVVPLVVPLHAAEARGVMTAAARSQGRMFMVCSPKSERFSSLPGKDRATGRGFKEAPGRIAPIEAGQETVAHAPGERNNRARPGSLEAL